MQRVSRLLVIASIMVFFVGCGPDTSTGLPGNGDTDNVTSTDNVDTDNAGTTDNLGGSDTVAGPDSDTQTMMTEAELQLATDALAAMNTHRAENSLAALIWYPAGAEVAYAHCLAMEAGDFFDHVDPDTNTDPAARALEAGITHDPQGFYAPHSGSPFVGENLYTTTGYTPTGQQAVDGWINSPGHHTQIDAPLPVDGAQTMPQWTHCGIGVRVSGGQSRWTAMFFRNPN